MLDPVIFAAHRHSVITPPLSRTPAIAFQSTNPFTGETVQRFDNITDAQLDHSLQATHMCFSNTWRQTSFAERKAVLARAAQLMRERAQSLAELATREMGKLIAQSVGDVKLSAAILDCYAG